MINLNIIHLFHHHGLTDLNVILYSQWADNKNIFIYNLHHQ